MHKSKHISKKGMVFLVLMVYLVTFAMGTMLGKGFQNGFMVSSVEGLVASGRLNILFMGIDARSNEENSRSDTIIVASIDKKTKKAVMVWIPRDTRVEVSPGHYDKINSVNYVQGPEAACQVVGELLDIKIKHYVLTNFDGFAEIVDILGGVHIDVESNMYHPDPDPRLRINLSQGMQLLSGEDALRYVRYRGGPTADIGRTQRQGKFIKALADEMIKTSTIVKLPQLLPKLMENVHTNLPVKEMGTLANIARHFSTDSIITQTLPGYSYTDPSNGASYWQADEEKTAGMIEALFTGESFEVMKDPPSLTNVSSTPVRYQSVASTPATQNNSANTDTPANPPNEEGNSSAPEELVDSDPVTEEDHQRENEQPEKEIEEEQEDDGEDTESNPSENLPKEGNSI
ncbi:MAG: LCP family protein [Syntrophomonadaceae bacterium]|nr:LCP family protein [Syntrophomonadaceae bacterium]